MLFSTNINDYLGHGIQTSRPEVAIHTANAICKLRTATTVTELRSFIGLWKVFRRYVQSFVRIASPLSARLQKIQTGLGFLAKDDIRALDNLRKPLYTPPILSLAKMETQPYTQMHDTENYNVFFYRTTKTEKYPDRSDICQESSPNRKKAGYRTLRMSHSSLGYSIVTPIFRTRMGYVMHGTRRILMDTKPR